jgi:hypothetical protein
VGCEVGSRREVLAEQGVGLLVGIALPGLARVTEAHTGPQRRGDGEVACNLGVLISNHRPEQRRS